MNTLQKTTALLLLAVALFGCERQAAQEKATDVAESAYAEPQEGTELAEIRSIDGGSDANYNANISYNSNNNTTQQMGLNDTTRKFVVKSKLKFRVDDVVKATYSIERSAVGSGGFVTHTEMRSNETNRLRTQTTIDSATDEVHYTITNNLTVRVPKHELDTFLLQVGQLSQYFDYRIIDADDVGLGLLKNTLHRKRLQVYDKQQQKAIEKKESKLEETVDAQENLLSRQLQADEMYVNRLLTLDEVQYSTVSIDIYGAEKVEYTRVAVPQPVVPYAPSFGTRLLKALQGSISILETILLFIIQAWPVWAILAIALWLYLRSKKRAKQIAL